MSQEYISSWAPLCPPWYLLQEAHTERRRGFGTACVTFKGKEIFSDYLAMLDFTEYWETETEQKTLRKFTNIKV